MNRRSPTFRLRRPPSPRRRDSAGRASPGPRGRWAILAGRIVARSALALDLDELELMRNLYKMGVKSLPIVVVTALFTGAIMVVQAAPIVKRYGAQRCSAGARASARCARSRRCSPRS